MFGLFGNRPVLDSEASDWLLDAFAWSLENFDADYFYRHTVLVQPSNEFFPGRADSTQAMAEMIFSRVKSYAGVAHWPTRVADFSACMIPTQPAIQITGNLRDPDGEPPAEISDDTSLLIPYNPQQVSNPEGLIASFAHALAHYLGQMARTPPPGGAEFWPHVTELLAIYLGFGLMFANSAYTFRGGCGSCYNPQANRDAYLTEPQSVYALAIFSVLKGLSDKDVTRHLKGHLRGFYKNATREVRQRAPMHKLLSAQQALALAQSR